MKAGRLNATDAAIESLARLCVKHGYGIAEVEQTLRKACTQAASRRCRMANGRVNHAHINAATGIPRSAIRKLLSGDSSRHATELLLGSTPAGKILAVLNRHSTASRDEDAIIRRLRPKLAPDSTVQALAKEIRYLRARRNTG